jgi:hypothetical protein
MIASAQLLQFPTFVGVLQMKIVWRSPFAVSAFGDIGKKLLVYLSQSSSSFVRPFPGVGAKLSPLACLHADSQLGPQIEDEGRREREGISVLRERLLAVDNAG